VLAVIWTVGHSTLEPQQLVGLLRRAEVQCLIDVRSHPGSRRVPEYGRERLERWVPEAGIAYEWWPELGGTEPLSHPRSIMLNDELG